MREKRDASLAIKQNSYTRKIKMLDFKPLKTLKQESLLRNGFVYIFHGCRGK